MAKRIVLRFRDLVTDEGETVAEHRAILRSHGEVWWGWWMRQYETLPRLLFGQILDQIEQQQAPAVAYLFNSGAGKIYRCSVTNIRVAPEGSNIASPEPEKTPEYYHRSRYAAWFQLSSIEEVSFGDLTWHYDSVPTQPAIPERFAHLIGQQVKSPDDLRTIDTTLWVIEDRDRSTGRQQLVRS